MTTTHWNGTISLVNGSNIATVTAGDPIADIYANSDLFFDGRDRPLEVVRAYNNGSNNVFELGTNYAGSNVTVSATISPGPGSILAAAKAAQALNESAQSITGSTATSSSANTIAKRTSDGRLKAANASANDDLVPLGQLGSSAQQDVYSGTYTGNSPDTILRQGDFGFGSASQSPVTFLPDNTHFPSSLGRDGDGAGGYPIFGWASSILNMRYNNARQSQIGISNGGLPQIAFRTMISNDTWAGPFNLFGEHNTNFNRIGGAGNGDEVLLGAASSGTVARFLLDNFDLNQATGLTIDTGAFRVDTMTGTTVSTGQPSVNVSLSSLTSTVIEVPVAGVSGTGELLRLRCDGGAAYATITH